MGIESNKIKNIRVINNNNEKEINKENISLVIIFTITLETLKMLKKHKDDKNKNDDSNINNNKNIVDYKYELDLIVGFIGNICYEEKEHKIQQRKKPCVIKKMEKEDVIINISEFITNLYFFDCVQIICVIKNAKDKENRANGNVVYSNIEKMINNKIFG